MWTAIPLPSDFGAIPDDVVIVSQHGYGNTRRIPDVDHDLVDFCASPKMERLLRNLPVKLRRLTGYPEAARPQNRGSNAPEVMSPSEWHFGNKHFRTHFPPLCKWATTASLCSKILRPNSHQTSALEDVEVAKVRARGGKEPKLPAALLLL